MHLIITGATGLVGSSALQYALVTSKVTKISILSRRPVPLAEGNPKAEVIIHKDFNTYPTELLEKLKGADGCVWALGISQSEVSKEVYKAITYDYTLAAADAFAGLSDPFKFVFVSGEGATATPGRFTPLFGQVKGETEEALRALAKTRPSLKQYSLRPAGVDPTFHPEIHGFYKTNMRVRFAGMIMPAMRALVPSYVSPTKDLGRILVELALGDGKPLEGTGISGDGTIIANVGFRRLAGI